MFSFSEEFANEHCGYFPVMSELDDLMYLAVRLSYVQSIVRHKLKDGTILEFHCVGSGQKQL